MTTMYDLIVDIASREGIPLNSVPRSLIEDLGEKYRWRIKGGKEDDVYDLTGHEDGLPGPEAELDLILESQNALMEAQFDREIDASLPGKN